MDEWTPVIEPVEISVCCIVKFRMNEDKILEYQEVMSFKGDWADLAFELYDSFGQFRDEVPEEKTKKYEVLEKIGKSLERKGESYDFKLADRTDDWYIAYCKKVVFRFDIQDSRYLSLT